MYLVKLSFPGGISFGGENAFAGIIHADTLFSALINQLVKLPGDLLSRGFNFAAPPFRLSSAFPFRGDTYYLPVPLGNTQWLQANLKNAVFLSLDGMLALSQGGTGSGNSVCQGQGELFYSVTTPRVSVDRITAVTNPYRAAGSYFPEGGGLYFLLDITDPGFFTDLKICIELLGESGLGGDRSVGFGNFIPEIISVEKDSSWPNLLSPAETGEVVYYLLALCYPRNNEEASQALFYRILCRRGWIFSSSSLVQMKRRECRMFAEGSVFTAPVCGGVADVTPEEFKEHRVYRYGRGIYIALQKKYIVKEENEKQNFFKYLEL